MEVPGQGDTMYRKSLLISSLFLTTALLAPAAIRANAAPQISVRVYDRDHRDYHNWNDNEDRSYRVYLGERHREYHPYAELRAKEQRAYWNWRHRHPDHDNDRDGR